MKISDHAKNYAQVFSNEHDREIAYSGFYQGERFMQEQMQRKVDQTNEDGELLAYNCEKRARQEVVDKAVSLAAEIFSRPEMKNFDKALDDFKAMLNENKE